MLALIASAAALPASRCSQHRDGFECVKMPGCGWCAHRYTCVPGREAGPLPGGLPCDGNSSDVALKQAQVLDMLYREPSMPGCATDWSKCAKYVGPLYTYTLDALNATGYRGVNYNTSAPELWDVLCESGGMRSSVVAHYAAGTTPYWVSQGCDCPSGRNGLTCGGCNAATGCRGKESCQRSLRTGAANLTCEIEEMVPDYVKLMTQWYNDSGVRLEYGVNADGGAFFRIQQAVENPNYAGFAQANGGDPSRGDGDRILSGTSALFLGSKTTGSSVACPAPLAGEVAYPWGDGDTCFSWVTRAGAGACPTDSPPDGPGDSGNFRGDVGTPIGWSRYSTGCPLIRAQLAPPVELICLGDEGTHVVDGQPTACVLRLPVRKMSMLLRCQLQGTCAASGSPPPPPYSPDVPPAQDVCGNASLHTYASCWTWLSYSVTWLSLLVGLLLPFGIRGCIRCTASLCNKRGGHAEAIYSVGSRLAPSATSTAAGDPPASTPTARQPLLNASSRPSVSLFRTERSTVGSPPPLWQAMQRPHADPSERLSLPEAAAAPPVAAHRAEMPLAGASPPDGGAQGAIHASTDDAAGMAARRGAGSCDAAGSSTAADGIEPGPAAAALSWSGLSYSIGPHQILQPSSHALRPGLHGLISHSGAGKSTLLGILAGRKARGCIGGSVTLGGVSLCPSERRLRIGYVPQEDVLPPTSTVSELLLFHARTRTPWLTGEERAALVGGTLTALSLTHKASARIGDAYLRGLSGGERRRVSLAVELLAVRGHAMLASPAKSAGEVGAARASGGPSAARGAAADSLADRQAESAAGTAGAAGGCMLLLDEPLSGLDSVNASLVLAALCELSGGALPSINAQLGNSPAHPRSPAASAATHVGCGADGSAPGTITTGPTGTSRPALTVFLSVHQPTHRVLTAMSGIVVIAPGGRMLYGGPTLTATGSCALTEWFDADGQLPLLRQVGPNPAEALLELLADTSEVISAKMERLIAARALASAADSYRCTPSGRTLGLRGEVADAAKAPPDRPRRGGGILSWTYAARSSVLRALAGSATPAGFLVQLDALSSRHCTLALRHPRLIWANFVSTLLLSVLCGCAFWQTGKNNALDSGVLQRIGCLAHPPSPKHSQVTTPPTPNTHR